MKLTTKLAIYDTLGFICLIAGVFGMGYGYGMKAECDECLWLEEITKPRTASGGGVNALSQDGCENITFENR